MRAPKTAVDELTAEAAARDGLKAQKTVAHGRTAESTARDGLLAQKNVVHWPTAEPPALDGLRAQKTVVDGFVLMKVLCGLIVAVWHLSRFRLNQHLYVSANFFKKKKLYRF